MKYIFLIVACFFSCVVLGQEKISPLKLHAEITSDLARNFDGGIKTGSVYMGNIDLIVDFDTELANLWKGGMFQLYLLNNHGYRLSSYVGDIQVSSNIEAFSSTRLYQFWYAHTVKSFKIIIGQHDLNSVFAYPENGALFLNSSFGIQPDIAANVPISIFPIASLGIVTKYEINKNIQVQAAIYDGDPGDEISNPYSIKWKINRSEGALAIGEICYKIFNNKAGNHTLKFGYWHHTAKFNSHHVNSGLFQSNQGAYFISDLTVHEHRNPELTSIKLFTQLGFSPKDCNLVDAYVGGGVTLNGYFNRKYDAFGLAFGHTSICNQIQTIEQIKNETVLELSYQLNIGDHLSIQPDLQYVIHPGGSTSLDNAFVGMLRIQLRN